MDFLLKVYVFYAVQHGLWLKRIIAAVTGTCIFGDAVTFIKDCRVLFGDIFISNVQPGVGKFGCI